MADQGRPGRERDRALAGPSGWRMRTRLVLLLAAVAALLFATLIAQLVMQDQQRDLRDLVLDNLDPAELALSDIRAGLADQETSLRGVALTRDPRFVESYEEGAEITRTALVRLDALLGDDERLEDDVVVVRRRVEEWMATSAAPVLAAETPEEEAEVRSPEYQATDIELLAGARAALDRVEEDLAAERAAVVADLEAAGDRVTWAMLVQVGGVILSGLVILGALARVVVGPIERLGRDARRVAAGDLDHQVRGEGSPDLARLGADVDAMRRRILDELAALDAARAGLERQAAELARSNADLEQFAYVASHDLQEPLRKVSSFCQLLQKRYGGQLDARADEYINYAVDGAKRMQDLINDLLAFSRVGRTTESFEAVDLGAVVDEVLAVLSDTVADAHATVEVGALPVVRGDRRLLGAAFQNLIANALKFRGEEPPIVEITATLSDAAGAPEWIVTVRDNGIGIDPDHGEQIFVIFKRLHAKTEYAGTGIGLALVKKIVEFHGGRIWLEPTTGPGSTFRLTLPAAATEGDTADAG